MTRKIKNAVGEWLPVVEDAIPLDQISPLALVVYQPKVHLEGSTMRALRTLTKIDLKFCCLHTHLTSVLYLVA